MTRLLLVAVASLSIAGCRSTVAPIELDVGGDAGTCAKYTDLRCVNYLRFSVRKNGEFTTQCVKVSEVLESLCDLPRLADGRVLFTVDPGDEVQFELTGMRAFPATSCESSECQPRVIFSGHTQTFRAGDSAGQPISMGISVEHECGGKEQFFPFTGIGKTCDEVCGGTPVCSFSDGCLCKAY
ncbi:MAG: hypothetical protein QM765_50395 [Myxococcales bacterium]